MSQSYDEAEGRSAHIGTGSAASSKEFLRAMFFAWALPRSATCGHQPLDLYCTLYNDSPCRCVEISSCRTSRSALHSLNDVE